MKTKIHSQSGVFNPRILVAFALGSVGVLLAMLSFAANPPRGMKTPSASSAGASAFVDNHAAPLKGNAAAPASSMPLAATGAAWSIVSSPNTSATQDNYLKDVTCTSASDCWAVGYYNFNGTIFPPSHTLIERWNGTAWFIVTSPNTSATQGNFLNGVTCTSASDCWAVGSYYNGSVGRTLIEHWNGTAWSIVTSPNTSATQGNGLSGVTCSSASDCWAVGLYNISSVDVDQTLIEHWNGTAWSIVTSPNTSATQSNYLSDVTCSSASDCWAVGGGDGQTLIEHWNGTTWFIVTSPNASTPQRNDLSGVTCASASDCWAVGYYVTGSSIFPPFHTLIERWNGTAWSIVTSPNTTTTQFDHLRDVTCASASDCWAVGDHSNQTLTEHWNGTAWSIVTSPNAMGPNYLFGVTCTSASDCWAVGYYFTGSSPDFSNQTLIERYSSIVPAQLDNISTRASVQTGQGVTIAGFIITGGNPKQVVIRGLGPTLTNFNVTGVLADPTLGLYDGSGTPIYSNNDWKDSQQAAIQATGLAPSFDVESAILITLQPGDYTAILSGNNGTTGVGLVEVYDIIGGGLSELTNVSTRGLVGTDQNVVIAGFITNGGNGSTQVVVRGLGPTLTQFGVSEALADPVVSLFDGNGNLVSTNNNWKDRQQAEIQATGLAPLNDLESAMVVTVSAGNYTAILSGNGGGTGIGLVEVYKL